MIGSMLHFSSRMENDMIIPNSAVRLLDAAAEKYGDKTAVTDEYGKLYADREEAAEEFRSLIDDVGSRFVPDEDMMELYRENLRMEE